MKYNIFYNINNMNRNSIVQYNIVSSVFKIRSCDPYLPLTSAKLWLQMAQPQPKNWLINQVQPKQVRLDLIFTPQVSAKSVHVVLYKNSNKVQYNII